MRVCHTAVHTSAPDGCPAALAAPATMKTRKADDSLWSTACKAVTGGIVVRIHPLHLGLPLVFALMTWHVYGDGKLTMPGGEISCSANIGHAGLNTVQCMSI